MQSLMYLLQIVIFWGLFFPYLTTLLPNCNIFKFCLTRASILIVSSSIPANMRQVPGPSVFSGAMGTCNSLHKLINSSRDCLHVPLPCSMRRRSSKIWSNYFIPSFLFSDPLQWSTKFVKNIACFRSSHRQAFFKVIATIPFKSHQVIVIWMKRY